MIMSRYSRVKGELVHISEEHCVQAEFRMSFFKYITILDEESAGFFTDDFMNKDIHV